MKRKRHQVRTTEIVFDRLRIAAGAQGRSVSAEIEHRLEMSFRDDDVCKNLMIIEGKLDKVIKAIGVPSIVQDGLIPPKMLDSDQHTKRWAK